VFISYRLVVVVVVVVSAVRPIINVLLVPEVLTGNRDMFLFRWDEKL
jgi:hypothetical protein